MLQLSLRESHPALIEHHPMQLLSPARIAESNDGFMNDCRRLLRGDENALRNFTDARQPQPERLCSYQLCNKPRWLHPRGSRLLRHKYNRENGEQERDGTDYNTAGTVVQRGRPVKKTSCACVCAAEKRDGNVTSLAGNTDASGRCEFGNSRVETTIPTAMTVSSPGLTGHEKLTGSFGLHPRCHCIPETA